eukprot:gnl/TRDRNA2_/TRDRNA2_177182_c2_seq2.p2 gnl/TRDRNA2_/TRDRNA2_177182_c2~~gnl/TRDRNA2_/TRDRNA2_177182_c2_seq2.p2  ORF type:complete len:111 (+),score=24.43 gnl/TRDRNA2_/TRDRNA2_177182_c2_seq2:34-333(+)
MEAARAGGRHWRDSEGNIRESPDERERQRREMEEKKPQWDLELQALEEAYAKMEWEQAQESEEETGEDCEQVAGAGPAEDGGREAGEEAPSGEETGSDP